MKTLLFKDASDEQLKHYAVVILGLSLGHNPKIKRETIINRIMQADPGREAIEADEAVVTPVPKKTGGAFAPTGGDTAIIRINKQEGKLGSQPVPLSFNGRCMLVPRGKWCMIPKAFYEVLKDAVEEQYEPLDGGGISNVPTMVPRFPWQLWESPGEPPELQRPPSNSREAKAA